MQGKDDQLETNLEEWTRYQRNIASRAAFEDSPNASFSAHAQVSSSTPKVGAFDSGAHDWDHPVACRIDTDSVQLEGLHSIGGVDISYGTTGDRSLAVACMVILDFPSMRLKHSLSQEVEIEAPYVPSYLAMRELPALLEVYDTLSKSIPSAEHPQVVFVDGFGRWHERQAGLATALGVERSIPTVGTGKEYQVLRPDLKVYAEMDDPPGPLPPWPSSTHFRHSQKDFRSKMHMVVHERGDFSAVPLYQGGPLVGAALYSSSARTFRTELKPLPIYASPGHLISLKTALILTLACCIRKESRQPEPILLADRLGRDEAVRLWDSRFAGYCSDWRSSTTSVKRLQGPWHKPDVFRTQLQGPLDCQERWSETLWPDLKVLEPIMNGHAAKPQNGGHGSSVVTIHQSLKKRPNLALWVNKEHQIYQKEEPYPECRPDSCVVHVKATGICGSEIHFWKSGRIGDCCVTHPIILGHESSGQIIEVGSNVKNFSVGDRVSIEPGVTCWECDMCLRGRYNLCPKVVFSGTPPSDGTMRRFVAHPAKFLHKMPEGMTYAQGALIEPLSVAYNAVVRANPHLAQPVLIAGAGPIGLSMAICARATGAYPICITDLEENRLAQARAMGFKMTVRVELGWDRMETAKRIMEIMGEDCRPEIAFECTGSEQSINSACYALRDGGTLLQVGCGKPEISVPLMSMGFREVNIVTSFRYTQSWPAVMRLVDGGVLGDVTGLITHTYPIEKTLEAFNACVDRTKNAIKVQIVDE